MSSDQAQRLEPLHLIQLHFYETVEYFYRLTTLFKLSIVRQIFSESN